MADNATVLGREVYGIGYADPITKDELDMVVESITVVKFFGPDGKIDFAILTTESLTGPEGLGYLDWAHGILQDALNRAARTE